jgi:hypothetical protein
MKAVLRDRKGFEKVILIGAFRDVIYFASPKDKPKFEMITEGQAPTIENVRILRLEFRYVTMMNKYCALYEEVF